MFGLFVELYARHVIKKAKVVPYCKENPYAYMDVGFATGVPLGRVLIQFCSHPHTDPVVANMLRLFEGDYEVASTNRALTLASAPIVTINSTEEFIMFGEVLDGWPSLGGTAAVTGGVLEAIAGKKTTVRAGAVVMLPQDCDAEEFTSVFYVMTAAGTVYDGRVVGQVVQGLDILKKVVVDYGTDSGVPEGSLFVNSCGQI